PSCILSDLSKIIPHFAAESSKWQILPINVKFRRFAANKPRPAPAACRNTFLLPDAFQAANKNKRLLHSVLKKHSCSSLISLYGSVQLLIFLIFSPSEP
ncbi:MAG: hypothetical protein ACOX78_05350, partial [Lachnospiraceae bacterium]